MTIDELRRIAAAATPGPWYASAQLEGDYGLTYATIGAFPVGTEDQPAKTCHDEDTICEVWNGEHDGAANAAYIAAANPAVVLALLDCVRAADAWSDAEQDNVLEARYDAARAALDAAMREG
jgi:hypothetical protein